MTTRRLDLIWLFLLAATGLAWWMAEWHADTRVTALVLGLALAKGGLVILDYMGLRGVRAWPALVLGWLALVLAAIAPGFLHLAGT